MNIKNDHNDFDDDNNDDGDKSNRYRNKPKMMTKKQVNLFVRILSIVFEFELDN